MILQNIQAVKGDAHCWIFAEELKKKKNLHRVHEKNCTPVYVNVAITLAKNVVF